MRAHVVENGVVVNTIEAESLSVLPNLIDADQYGGGIGWLWNGATLTAPAPVVVIPESVSNVQGQMALYNTPSGTSNLLAVVEAYLPTAPKPQQIAFSAATWQRASPSLNAMATALGLTSAQVDALFIAAAEIVI